MMRLIYNPSYE